MSRPGRPALSAWYAERRQWLRMIARGIVGFTSLRRAAMIAMSTSAARATAQSTPSLQEQQIELDRAINRIFTLQGVTIREGKVTVEVPALADNGNSVACVISVDSPMTEADHVRTVHLFLARNPRPFAISAYLTPRSVRARIETRIRLAGSQRVLAVAEMNDGSCWSGSANVAVTVSACVDGS